MKRLPSPFGSNSLPTLPLTLTLLVAAGACRSSSPSASWEHRGPVVSAGNGGPARFVEPLYARFDAERALIDAGYFDGFYRAPGSTGYAAALARLASRLGEAGFAPATAADADAPLTIAFQTRALEHPSWTPQSGRVDLVLGDGSRHALHAFRRDTDPERLMLPRNGLPGAVEGRPVFGIGEVEAGTVLVTEARVDERLIRMAAERGALAILSSRLLPFNVDPSGAERELDAILYTELSATPELPVLQISPRSHAKIEASAEGDNSVRVAVEARVEYGEPSVDTLVATVRGAEQPNEAVVVACHIEKPGPGGAVGVCEGLAALARGLAEGQLEWPARTLVFLWGDEVQQSEHWLDATEYTVVAALSADMLGQDPERTGSLLLIERPQDPGALRVLPPDEHTAWGAADVAEADLHPSGLALIARTAVADVATLVGGWRTAEHPWEGGSDHDVFLKRGIPALLFWQFTGFTYQTSLDRVDWLDAEELRRSSVAVLATALSVADPEASDLPRYLASLERERELRVGAAGTAGEDATAERWSWWCDGAADWLTSLCR